MGALLSLPLLALPSMSTVCCMYIRLPMIFADVGINLVDNIRSFMLWSGHLFGRLQCLWEVPKQVNRFSS